MEVGHELGVEGRGHVPLLLDFHDGGDLLFKDLLALQGVSVDLAHPLDLPDTRGARRESPVDLVGRDPGIGFLDLVPDKFVLVPQ